MSTPYKEEGIWKNVKDIAQRKIPLSRLHTYLISESLKKETLTRKERLGNGTTAELAKSYTNQIKGNKNETFS